MAQEIARIRHGCDGTWATYVPYEPAHRPKYREACLRLCQFPRLGYRLLETPVTDDARMLARSLRHLRPRQIPARAWRITAENFALAGFGFRTPSANLADSAPSAPSPRLALWSLRPREALAVASDAIAGRFQAAGVARDYGENILWADASTPRLFRFALNSFEFALAMAVSADAVHGSALVRLLEQWTVDNRPRRGDPWHPFVIAQRLINLLSTRRFWMPHAPTEIVANLDLQARTLGWILEHDIGGNHLIREATAMAVAGDTFANPALLGRAGRILERQIETQILPDGGHFERSPSYHLEVLTDLVEVRALPSVPDRVRRTIDRALERMATFAISVLHPDGTLPMFNDCFAWPVPVPDFLAAIGLSAEPRSAFPQSGYQRVDEGDTVTFVDVGPPSPPHLPPHAHSDLLSIEVSVSGRPLLVNSGTGDYERGPWRDYWRSTRAHNTVEVDGENQSETWGSFRMARRARPVGVLLQEEDGFTSVTAAHDGYRRLRSPVTHRRSVVQIPGALVVVDMLLGDAEQRVRSFLHAHPDADVAVHAERGVVTRGTSSMIAIPFGPLTMTAGRATDHPIENWHAEAIGERRPAAALVLEGRVRPPTVFGWVLIPGASSTMPVAYDVKDGRVTVRVGERTIRVGEGERPVEVE